MTAPNFMAVELDDETLEFILTLAAVGFALCFFAFIFIISYIDNKKDKKILTEIFQKYGVKTNARILAFRDYGTSGRGVPSRYVYFIGFQYHSAKVGEASVCYNLHTNHPGSKAYVEEIPIIYIPAYVDYDNHLISLKELYSALGHKLRYGLRSDLVMFAEDLSVFTNLSEF